jgi:acyl carrier protein phosphodiesterase
MNYLAHAFLSFGNPEITVGNLISDFVKGKKQYEFSPAIQEGIRLHRAIDAFTDQHPATLEAKKIFQPAYRLYSAAFIDVVYDHFLATDSVEFTDSSLKTFTEQTYVAIEPFSLVFPEKFAMMFPYMKSQNWLYNYQFRWGLEKSFGGLVRRSAYLSESETAFRLFEENYTALQDFYQAFMPDVKSFAMEKMKTIFAEPNRKV